MGDRPLFPLYSVILEAEHAEIGVCPLFPLFGDIFMQDILDVMTSRKSIRRYKADPVPDEMLDKILESARWAPTGENYQPWRFIVVRDQETRNKIGDLAQVGSGSRMTAWYCLGHMQERFAGIQDPEKRAKVLRFMYSGEVSEFAKQSPVVIAVIGTLMEGSVDGPYDLSPVIQPMTR